MNNELLQPLWYEKGTPASGSFFFGRHSTATVKDVIDGVCDYTLHPIRKSDANLLLYHSIWDMLSGDEPMDFYKTVCGEHSIVRKQANNAYTEWMRPFLLFPSDDESQKYLLDHYLHPFFVAGYSMSTYSYGESGIIEEDDEPVLSVYFVPEWSTVDGEKEVVYRELSGDESLTMPYLDERPDNLKNNIRTLLAFLDRNHVDAGDWNQRLELSLRMIDTHANELHILHNVGLYDIDKLWTLLLQKGLAGQELFRLSSDVTRRLHQYAMAVVNLIDWKNGGRFAQSAYKKEEVKIQKDMPPSFWNNVEAMEKAFEWTPQEEELLTRAFYGTDRHNAGANYVDLLRELVRKRMDLLK